MMKHFNGRGCEVKKEEEEEEKVGGGGGCDGRGYLAVTVRGVGA